MKSITVLMSTCNRAALLRESVDSILNQSFRDFELLIIDNCSTDNTAEVVASYSDPRIKYVRNDTKLSGSESFNRGLDMASGEHIAIQHDDDIAYPDRLALQAGFLDNNPEMGVCGGFLKFFGKRHGIWKVPEDRYLKTLLFARCPFPHAVFMFRRKTLLEHNIRHNTNYSLAYDHWILCEIAQVAGVGAVREPVLNYRVHPGQESTKLAQAIAESELVRLEYFLASGCVLDEDEKNTLIGYLISNRVLRGDKTVGAYEKISKLIDKLADANSQKGYWSHGEFMELLGDLWEKCCVRGVTGLSGMYKRYKAQQSISYFDSLPGFYLYPIRWKLGFRGLLD